MRRAHRQGRRPAGELTLLAELGVHPHLPGLTVHLEDGADLGDLEQRRIAQPDLPEPGLGVGDPGAQGCVVGSMIGETIAYGAVAYLVSARLTGELGVRTVLDLRTGREVDEEGPGPLRATDVRGLVMESEGVVVDAFRSGRGVPRELEAYRTALAKLAG